MTNEPEIQSLLERASRGDQPALAELFRRFEGRLRRLVELRMDRRMQGRVGASDVLQEAYLEASRRLEDYVANPAFPFFLWLRLIAGQTLTHFHQHHLQAKMRDARREVSLHRDGFPEATSEVLAACLLDEATSPSQAAERHELQARLRDGLEALDPMDREVLVLRHFEHLTIAEIAQVLSLNAPAASKRYVRAGLRLAGILKSMNIESAFLNRPGRG
jgi:RNA polymerase sigma-70 factor (ECF subfamily)